MSPRQRRLVATALGQVHCVEAGEGEGPPVVLLHQTPRSVDEFAEVQPLLAGSHRVVALDTPGYGCSDRPRRQPTIADYAAALMAVLDGLEIPSAHLVGHHTGAVIAIEAAAAFPDRVAKVVLSGPVYLDREMRQTLRAVFLQWRVRPDGSHLTEKWLKFSAWTDKPGIVQRALVDLVRAGETSEFGHFAAASYRMEDRLPLVRCPALLILGERDPFRFEPNVRALAERLPECRSAELAGGVFLPNEAPEAFAREVSSFL